MLLKAAATAVFDILGDSRGTKTLFSELGTLSFIVAAACFRYVCYKQKSMIITREDLIGTWHSVETVFNEKATKVPLMERTESTYVEDGRLMYLHYNGSRVTPQNARWELKEESGTSVIYVDGRKYGEIIDLTKDHLVVCITSNGIDYHYSKDPYTYHKK